MHRLSFFMSRNPVTTFVGRLSLGVLLLVAASAMSASADDWQQITKLVDYDPHQAISDAEQSLRQARRGGDKAGELRALWVLTLANDLLNENNIEPADISRGAVLANELGDRSALCWFVQHQP